MLNNLFTILLILGGFLPYIQAQTGISEAAKKHIQSRVENGINTGIAVGIIDSDGTHYYSYGVKSLATGEAVDEHSIFEIGSISKTFTGVLLADLVIKGKVKLDDPLQNYLPDGVTAPTRNGAAITLKQMSNHTSSLPRMPDNFAPENPGNPYIDYSEEQLYEFLNGHALTRDIGSEYEYSNYAVGLLGHVLATMQEKTYEEWMIERIAKPLKLTHTRIALTPEMKKNLAMGHSGGIQVENWDLTTLAGAGAIRSSVVDMLAYIAANMGNKKSSLYPAMQLAHQPSRAAGSTPMVGLGWHILEQDEMEIVWHNGGTGGYRAFAGFIKGGDKGVVVLTNSDEGVDGLGIHLLNPNSPLSEIKPGIGSKLRSIIESDGIEAGKKSYWDLKKNQADKYDFSENQLNNLGYYYLGKEEMEKAIAVFSINVKAYPEAFNVYDSMGEAYMKQGDTEKAIANYTKSIELNPGNEGGIKMLKELGVDTKDLVKEVVVDAEILESYVGKYELMQGFILTVTKEGSQLSAQATGQPGFPIFPKSENVFYYKVVEAQLVFNQNENGVVESVTLLQGGQEIVGKKLGE